MKFRKQAFEKLMKAYEISEPEKCVKICSKNGEHFIIIHDEYCWKEILEFKGNTLEYKIKPYQEFFNAIK